LSELELCKVCKKGHLRPTGEATVSGEVKEPFRETDTEREVECDNPECATNQTNYGRNMYEPEIVSGESLEGKVTSAADLEKMKNNPRLCTSCQKEKDIVFTKDNVRVCKECLNNFKDRYG